MRLLAEDDDLVPGQAPLAGHRPRVHVRTGPTQQVPVPEQNAHAPSLGHVPAGQVWGQTPDVSTNGRGAPGPTWLKRVSGETGWLVERAVRGVEHGLFGHDRGQTPDVPARAMCRAGLEPSGQMEVQRVQQL